MRANKGEFPVKMVISHKSLYYKELAVRNVPLEKMPEEGKLAYMA
jgi:hypothetical protein